MAEPFGTFRSVLEDQPWFGGQASPDVGTPTPTSQSALPQTPGPSMAMGDPGVRDRVRQIGDNLQANHALLKQVESFRPPLDSEMSWLRLKRIAMREEDHPDVVLMQQKTEMLSKISAANEALMEEYRLLTQKSPQDEMAEKEAGDRDRRATWIAHLKSIGVKLTPEQEFQAIEGGLQETKIDETGASADPLTRLGKVADLGVKGVGGFLPKEDQPAADAARVAAEKKEAQDRASKPGNANVDAFEEKYGLKPKDMLTAVERRYDDFARELAEQKGFVVKEGMGLGDQIQAIRAVIGADGAREARRRAAASFPGFQEWFPKWVGAGLDEPVQQKDLSPTKASAARDVLKSRKPAEKK